jgi:hypothetical protein
MDAPRNVLKEKGECMKHCPQCSTGYPDSLAACPTHRVPLNKMRKRRTTAWILALLIGAAALPALSQQDEGPILRPKKPIAKPTGATLLMMCDLTCDWKLDGTPMGRINAGGSAKAKVELGQHMVVATTEDAFDKVEYEIKIRTAEQTIMRISLQPVRDARLKADQEARDKAQRESRERVEQEARDKAVREQREKEEKERKRVAQEEAAGVWTDPATELMWEKEDNQHWVTWQQATDYCQRLQLAGHSDWRLPTIDEFKGIYDPKLSYDPKVNIGDYHLKGNLHLENGYGWSSSQGSYSGEKEVFSFYNGIHISQRLDESDYTRALCVRRSGE